MATIGKIEKYNQGTEVWTHYVERLEHFFVAFDIVAETKKKATLLAVCGQEPTKYSVFVFTCQACR